MQATIDRELSICVPMCTHNLADLRWRAWSYLTAAGVASGMVEDILIALHEAVANAIRHSSSCSDIVVCLKVCRKCVTVEVKDEGIGLPAWVELPPAPPDPHAEGGRGLYMIWALMSSVRLASSRGTHLIMTKELFPSPA